MSDKSLHLAVGFLLGAIGAAFGGFLIGVAIAFCAETIKILFYDYPECLRTHTLLDGYEKMQDMAYTIIGSILGGMMIMGVHNV